jgi:hypothetical protein
MTLLRFLLLLLALLPAACGDLPEPFLGNPGATARILAQPPTPRLAVPAPPNAMLSDGAASDFSGTLALALQRQEVPAVQGTAQPGDWRLDVVATQRGDTVVPVYTILDPRGKNDGKWQGKAVSAADWANASSETLSQAAADAAPGIADLLTGIQATLQQANPNSLYNRPARVQLLPVTGAPGDGNTALTSQMRTILSKLGPIVQDTPTNADFIVKGQVVVVPIAGGQQRVEIQWHVLTPSGDERGRVVQLNDVPAGTLNGYWGDIATVVAQEAAGGVRDVILRQSGRDPNAQDGKPGASPAGKPGVTPAGGGTVSPGPAGAAGSPASTGPGGAPPSQRGGVQSP